MEKVDIIYSLYKALEIHKDLIYPLDRLHTGKSVSFLGHFGPEHKLQAIIGFNF
jgi:hypothetical protein